MRRLLAALGELGRELLREGGAHVLATADHLADRPGQVLVGAALVDVSGAARLEYLAGVHFLGQDAQHQHRPARILPLDLPHQIGVHDAIRAVDVHKFGVRLGQHREGHRAGGSASLQQDD